MRGRVSVSEARILFLMESQEYNDRRAREGMAVTVGSIAVNLVLIVAKCGAGWLSNSHALIADGIHSIVDTGSDIAACVGLKMSAKPGDERHPYGHHRFVTLITLGISGSVLLFCFGLGRHSVARLLQGEDATPVQAGWVALAVAASALVVKESFYQYAIRQARRLKSGLLMANAMDHRTDAIASLLALITLLAVRYGGPAWAAADSVAGLLLAGWLGLEAFKLCHRSIVDLTDTAPAAGVMKDLSEHILPVAGVRGFHAFRARRVGDMIDVDFHLQVSGDISVEAGHEIATKVKGELLSRHPEVIDALIHVEPDSDHHMTKRRGLFGVND